MNVIDKIKLFCLPYAGGSATVYYKWRSFLNRGITLCPVELAGRGKRIREPLYNNMEEAVGDICGRMKESVGESPYALFGHSLGGVLAIETLYKLKETGYRKPDHVFFSGCRPPHLLNKQKTLHTLPDEQFKEEVLRMGGTDKEVFENEELSNYFTRLLKSDFKLVELYKYSDKHEKLKTNITVFAGSADDIAPFDDITEWKKYTTESCEIMKFEGGHFFINSFKKEIVDCINSTLI